MHGRLVAAVAEGSGPEWVVGGEGVVVQVGGGHGCVQELCQCPGRRHAVVGRHDGAAASEDDRVLGTA